MSSTEATTANAIRITGQVKWFNNKAGYGFITVNSGEQIGKDIFAHYSAIRVTNSQYKYLVQGEYVEFDLVSSTAQSHEYQALNISGIHGGSLMCETRRNTNQPSDNRPQNTADRPRIVSRPPRILSSKEDAEYVSVHHGKPRRRISTRPATPAAAV
jgi:cold shock CspA family protein